MWRKFNINITDEQLEKYRKQFEVLFEEYSQKNEEFKAFFEEHPEKKEDYMWKLIDSNALGPID